MIISTTKEQFIIIYNRTIKVNQKHIHKKKTKKITKSNILYINGYFAEELPFSNTNNVFTDKENKKIYIK